MRLSKRLSKKALSILFLLIFALGIVEALIHEIDKTSFPGCTIVGYEHGFKTLVIELDPDLNNGSDGACEVASELIYKICSSGYTVKVVNSHLSALGVINLEQALGFDNGYLY